MDRLLGFTINLYSNVNALVEIHFPETNLKTIMPDFIVLTFSLQLIRYRWHNVNETLGMVAFLGIDILLFD